MQCSSHSSRQKFVSYLSVFYCLVGFFSLVSLCLGCSFSCCCFFLFCVLCFPCASDLLLCISLYLVGFLIFGGNGVERLLHNPLGITSATTSSALSMSFPGTLGISQEVFIIFELCVFFDFLGLREPNFSSRLLNSFCESLFNFPYRSSPNL